MVGKIVRNAKNKELLKRLDNLHHLMKHKDSESVFVSVEEWIETTGTETFIEYCEKRMKSKSHDAVVLIDDMILETDMYLDLSCILVLSKDEVSEFIKLTNSPDEFMKKYIDAFENLYVVKGNGNRVPEMQKSLLSNCNEFINDFYEQYKILSVEELVERYKDQRFFSKNRRGTN